MRAEVEAGILGDVEQWLKKFHQFLLDPSCNSAVVMGKLMEMKSRLEMVAVCDNLAGDAQWKRCQELIKTIVALINERHFVVVGIEDTLKQINGW